MSTGAFSLDQLMELAGLSVSQVGRWQQFPNWIAMRQVRADMVSVYRVHPVSKGSRVLVAVGPGNNGELFLLSLFTWPPLVSALTKRFRG
jgi:NAD(P)H-hydrate epimerase